MPLCQTRLQVRSCRASTYRSLCQTHFPVGLVLSVPLCQTHFPVGLVLSVPLCQTHFPVGLVLSVPLCQTHFQVGLVGQIPIGPSVSDPHSSSSGRSCVTVIIYHSQHSHVRPTLKCLSDPTTHVSDPTGSSLTGPVGQSVPLYQTHPEVFLQELSDN